jgi:hypothetical protein
VLTAAVLVMALAGPLDPAVLAPGDVVYRLDGTYLEVTRCRVADRRIGASDRWATVLEFDSVDGGTSWYSLDGARIYRGRREATAELVRLLRARAAAINEKADAIEKANK